MRLGIIGGGRIFGHYLAACEAAGVSIVAVCDTDQSRLNALPHRIFGTQSLDELLLNPDLDAVVVATPTNTHYQIAQYVLSRGKPLVLEKPAALSLAELNSLIEISGQNSTPAFILMHANYGIELDGVRPIINRFLESNPSPCISWHASFFDPYQDDDAAQSALVNSWVDSGINALTTIFSTLPQVELRHLAGSWTPKGIDRAKSSAVQCYAIGGSCNGLAVIETNWCQGMSHKSSRVSIGSELVLEIRHSEEQLRIIQAGQEKFFDFSSVKPRMQTHYERAFADMASHLTMKRSNWEQAKRAHISYFKGFENNASYSS